MSDVHVAYQGIEGSYSSVAAREYFPGAQTYTGYPTFGAVIEAVQRGSATHALLPIENSTAGRVADIHHLLPDSGLSVIGEHFLPIHHALIGIKGSSLEAIHSVYSHREALAQCRNTLVTHNVTPVPFGDTAGAVAFVARENNPAYAALASVHAATHHENTQVLREHMEDKDDNVTRFLILVKDAPLPSKPHNKAITSLVYDVHNEPMALYTSLRGFAENGINIIKLESFVPMTRNKHAQFYLEFEGNMTEVPSQAALEILKTCTHRIVVLGSYRKSAFRTTFE